MPSPLYPGRHNSIMLIIVTTYWWELPQERLNLEQLINKYNIQEHTSFKILETRKGTN